ncbi:MAG: leucine-rich repeat domain-containing protein [Prevotellaceae bacterium]|nr:leucine-rich repeat domain-containing protein [Candidatus Colivivens equi]
MKKLLFTILATLYCMAMNAQDVTFTAGGIKYNVTGDNTVEVGENSNLSGSVVIPATVTNPDDGKTCNVTGIGEYAFYSNRDIPSVSIPEGVTYIGSGAFRQTALTSISLPEGLISIGSHAFFSCTNIKGDLVIPSTVKSIGEGAFKSVSVNTVKVFALDPPELGKDAFETLISCYVPDVEKYQDRDGWKDFQNIKLLTDFRLGDQMYSLNETGERLDQDLTFNDKDLYVSSFDFTANKLTYSRTFKNTNWQPLYVPFTMSYDDWEGKFDVAAINNFHEYTDEKGQTIKTELEVRLVKEHTLKPNHPYLIKAHIADATKAQEINISSKKMYKSYENSIVCSSVERKYTFTGTYRDITGMRTDDYIFLSDGKLCKATDDNVKLSAQRWYLSIESLGSQFGDYNNVGAKAFSFDVKLLDDEATGIDEITVTRTPLKNRSEAIYNLNGIRVNGNYKGIVIKNGKKVYQK